MRFNPVHKVRWSIQGYIVFTTFLLVLRVSDHGANKFAEGLVNSSVGLMERRLLASYWRNFGINANELRKKVSMAKHLSQRKELWGRRQNYCSDLEKHGVSKG